MKYLSPLFPFLIGWAVILSTESLASISIINGISQLLLFALVVCFPAWRTGRMSYVDIGWPWGVALIGILTWLYSEGNSIRVSSIAVIYILIGGRMGFGALKMWKVGMLYRELPRYEYQKRRWEKAGKNNTALAMQIETILQGLANTSFLAMPAFIIATNSSSTMSIFEIIGVLIWLSAFIMESVADMQKLSFLRRMKKLGKKNQVCNVGFWKYSRHPNYFAEWMVWNGLIIASIPSWTILYEKESLIIWGLLGLGLLLITKLMYNTLVYYTGAIPSEYYSLQKRPGYKYYQESTNIFFPGPNRKDTQNTHTGNSNTL